MPRIPIHAAAHSESELPTVVEQMETLHRAIQSLAHTLSLTPERARATPLDHWLEAERTLAGAIDQERQETDSAYQVCLTLPLTSPEPISAADIDIVALPQTLLVAINPPGASGETPALARRIDFPAPVEASACSALLTDGVLMIEVRKAGADHQPQEHRTRAAGAS